MTASTRVYEVYEANVIFIFLDAAFLSSFFFWLFPMANKDKDVTEKGKELWRALRNKPFDLDVARNLLGNGAPPNFREPTEECRDETDRTPLHFVVVEKQGHEDLMNVLLEKGADTNLVDCFDLTPLHLAVERGNLQAVKALLRNHHCQADVKKPNRGGETPLEIAVRKGHHDVISYLLKEDQAGVSSDGIVRNDGSTHVTVIANNVMVGDNNKMELKQ